MERNVIYTHSLQGKVTLPPRKEILRYLGHRGEVTDEVNRMIDVCLPYSSEKSVPKSAFVIKKINMLPSGVCIDGTELKSTALKKNLDGCEEAIIFASTIGAETDRFISAQFAISPANAIIADAIATATVEHYCDMLFKELGLCFEKEELFLRPRFSPGYGDLTLDNQKFFIEQTDASKRCGIYLTRSMMLTPAKSITGITGLSKTNTGCPPSGCEVCSKKNCKFKR